jgi:membrane-associated protease RseP (regulator of RpoE activity)
MLRRPIQTVIALATIVCAVNLLDSRSADAQGLLQRIQSRIQSRIAAPPVDPPQQPQTPPQAARPGAPADRDLATPEGRRIRPILPSRDDAGSGSFGGSILAPRNELPTRTEADSTSARPTLGIDVLQSRGATAGVRVHRFRDESLADDAGLRLGDIIVAIDGVDTPTIAAVANELSAKRLGQRIEARVMRGNEDIDLTIPLVSRFAEAAKPNIDSDVPLLAPPLTPLPAPAQTLGDRSGSPNERLGVSVTDAQGLRGAVVAEVIPGKAGAAAGLEVGDRIVSLDGKLIADASALRNRLARLSDGDPLSLRLVRNGGLINKELQTGQPAPQGVTGASDAGPSTFEGIGSMLGGLLGGQPVATEPRKKGQPLGEPASEKDVMALGDEQKVRRVGFDERTNVNDLPRGSDLADGPISLTDDPPSLDILDLPTPAEIDPVARTSGKRAEALKTAAELRREIRLLESRLRALEADKPKADTAGKPADE